MQVRHARMLSVVIILNLKYNYLSVSSLQNLCSAFWWNALNDIPILIPLNVDYSLAVENLISDQKRLNKYSKVINANDGRANNPRENSMIFKIKRYYRQFGFKSTIKRFVEKISGR
jgi:hypothetical protein